MTADMIKDAQAMVSAAIPREIDLVAELRRLRAGHSASERRYGEFADATERFREDRDSRG
jgi:hypothetical protein